MNITVACDVLGEANNGTTIATLNLIRYLMGRGHKVTVISNNFEGSGIPEENRCLLKTVDLGSVARKIFENNGVSLAKADATIIRAAIENADVVHAQFPFGVGCNTARIAREIHKPVTASFHCQAENISAHVGLTNNLFVSKQIYKWMWKHFYSNATIIHYPTQFIRDTFETAAGVKTNGMVISNGVNKVYYDKKQSRENDKFWIVMSGRLGSEKAQHILIQAVAKSKYKDKIKIFFAGEGPLLNRYRSMAKKLGVDADFNFYTQKDLVALLNKANLYVHTAFIEIEAISCMEAICCGLVPVIANSPRSATKNFALDERNLFKQNDPADLCRQIEYWYEHPAEKEQCSKNYQSLRHSFDQDECMKQMEKMMVQAIQENS